MKNHVLTICILIEKLEKYNISTQIDKKTKKLDI